MRPPKKTIEETAAASTELIKLKREASRQALETHGADLSKVHEFNAAAKAEGFTAILLSTDAGSWA